MNADTKKTNESERLGSLETTVEGFHDQFRVINRTLEKIQDSLSSSRQTNWTVVLAGIAVGLGVWAAAIHPLNQDIERGSKTSETLAQAVVVKDVQIQDLRNSYSTLTARFDLAKQELDDLRDNGSRITDKRLSILEFEMNIPVKIKPN